MFSRYNQGTWKAGALTGLIIGLALLLAGCVGGQPQGWAGPVVQGNTLYLGSREGRVLAYNLEARARQETFPASGEWMFPPKGEAGLRGLYGRPLVAGGAVYLGTFDGKVYALDAATGVMKWQAPFSTKTKGAVLGSLALAGDTLLAADGEGWLYFLDPERGTEKRPSAKVGGAIWSSPLVSGNMIYLSSLDHKLYALDVRSGSPLWVEPFQAGGALVATPALSGDTLYLGSFDRKFYAVEAATGRPRWPQPYNAKGWFWSQALVSGGVIYAGSLDHKVYALEARDGALRWPGPVDLGGQVKAAPVLEAGVLVVATAQGLVYGLDPATGNPTWNSPHDAGAPILAPLEAAAGAIYVYANNGVLRALEASSGRSLWWVRTNKTGSEAIEPVL